MQQTHHFFKWNLLLINREYAMLRLADENVAKKSRIMMLLISPWLDEPVTQENS